jgi:hypothetical protein
MAPNVVNLLSGVGRLYIGNPATATGTAGTTAGPDVMPGDAIPYGQPWSGVGTDFLGRAYNNPGNWRDMGFTSSGVKVVINQSYNAIKADQQLSPVLHIRTATDEQIQTELLEATLANIYLVAGRGDLTTTAGSPGHMQLRLTSDARLTYVALGFEGIAPPNDSGHPRRIVFPLCLSTGNMQVGQLLTDVTKIAVAFMRVGGAEGDPLIRDVGNF